ncbi:MAG: DUF4912 domain-containing protein [bacterium]|nr:DUF4912 domain-containing protein [bacterium]
MKNYTNLKKIDIIKMLNKKKIKHDPEAGKDELIKLLVKQEKGTVKKEKPAKKAAAAAGKKKAIKKAPGKKVIKVKAVQAAKAVKPARTRIEEQMKGSTSLQPVMQEHYIKDELEKYHPLPDYKILKNYDFRVPESYNLHKLILLVVDPYWLYSYWEIKKEALNELTKKYSEKIIRPDNLYLKIFDVTYIDFNGKNAHRVWEIKVNSFKGNWFVNVNKPNSNFTAKLGFKDKQNNFIEVLSANVVKTPSDRISDNIVQLWASVDIDKPIALVLMEQMKEYVKYKFKIDSISYLPGSIFGSMTFLKNKKGS